MADMWKLWVAGILGGITALVPFLGLTPDLERVITAAFGIAIAIFAFWAAGAKKTS